MRAGLLLFRSKQVLHPRRWVYRMWAYLHLFRSLPVRVQGINCMGHRCHSALSVRFAAFHGTSPSLCLVALR